MRSLHRRAIVAATCLSVGAVLGTGCDAKLQTEYVTGISTQVKVPRDLKSVLVNVSVGGVQQFCRAYKVYDGKIQLPRSLGTFAQNDPNGSGPITYTIVGISEEFTDTSANPLFDGTCTSITIGQNKARILRRSRQPYQENKTLFLPLPLKYACVDRNCPDEQTCKGGVCVDAATDPATLPSYAPELADGTGGTCFHVNEFTVKDGDGKDVIRDGAPVKVPGCMTGATPVVTVDAATCTYALLGSKDMPPALDGNPKPLNATASGDGINVSVTYDALVTEVLDYDKDEGFIIPDAAHPQIFRLAPGLCDMVKGTNGAGHTIANIRASGTCQAKRPTQPMCLPDQLAAMGMNPDGTKPLPDPPDVCLNVPLKPSPSALMLVVDDSTNGASFFAALNQNAAVGETEDNIIGPAVTAAFATPTLVGTKLGVFYTTSKSCAESTAPADVQVANISVDNVDDTFTTIQGHGTGGADPQLGAGLARAYNELNKPEYVGVKRGVVLFSRNFSDAASCGEAISSRVQTQRDGNQITTYPMQVVRLPEYDPTAPTDALKIAQAGGPTTPGASNYAAYRIGGTFGAANKFRDIIQDFTTCSYDIETSGFDANKMAQLTTPFGAGDELYYSDVTTGESTKLPFDFSAACTERNGAGDSWGAITNGTTTRVYLCGGACTAYRSQLNTAILIGSTFGKPAPAVPLLLRRSSATCATAE